jgi:hypothetical protein
VSVHASGLSNVAVYHSRVQPKSAIQWRVKGAAGTMVRSCNQQFCSHFLRETNSDLHLCFLKSLFEWISPLFLSLHPSGGALWRVTLGLCFFQRCFHRSFHQCFSGVSFCFCFHNRARAFIGSLSSSPTAVSRVSRHVVSF